jgi:hypothetical protein
VHALFALVSALNRYRVRPWELTRIDPRLLFATPTVAGALLVVFDGAGVAVAAPLLLPQAATVKAASRMSAAPARKLMGCLRVMRAPSGWT